MLTGRSRRRMCSVAIYLLAHDRTGPKLPWSRWSLPRSPVPITGLLPVFDRQTAIGGLTTSRAIGSRGGWVDGPPRELGPGPARGSRSPRGQVRTQNRYDDGPRTRSGYLDRRSGAPAGRGQQQIIVADLRDPMI